MKRIHESTIPDYPKGREFPMKRFHAACLDRTWNPKKTQPPFLAGVRSTIAVGYWLQMAFHAQMTDDLLLVWGGAGGCLETAFGMAFDDYGRTGYGRETFQDVAKTG